MNSDMRPDTIEETPVGWTCPVCERYNLAKRFTCTCGFNRDWDFPMDDEYEEAEEER